MHDGIGLRFLRETAHARGRLVGGRMDWNAQPEWFKVYPDVERVTLPEPETEGGPGVFDVMARRHSVRSYSGQPLTLDDLATLLWSGAGVTREELGIAFRTAPSAGGLYPIETYLVVNRVDGLERGVYHYAVLERALERLRSGDYRLAIAQAALDQNIAAAADVVFVWSAVLERSAWKYGQRALRYIFLDAAHIAQNVALAAVAIGAGSCQIAAIYDDEANALLGLDGDDESVVYLTTVGRSG